MVPQREWGVGAGCAEENTSSSSDMEASRAGEKGEATDKNCQEGQVANNVARQDRGGTRVDEAKTRSPTSILRKPAEASAGRGDSSTAAATKHHQSRDEFDDRPTSR